jgi:hypothetical protein
MEPVLKTLKRLLCQVIGHTYQVKPGRTHEPDYWTRIYTQVIRCRRCGEESEAWEKELRQGGEFVPGELRKISEEIE